MNKFTLLTDEQTFGSKKIEVIKKLGTKCVISDFTILLGANFNDKYHMDADSSLKGRTGSWYLSTSNCGGNVRYVTLEGNRDRIQAGARSSCVRPVLPFSKLSDISQNVVRGNNGLLEVTYGEYPQYAVDPKLNEILDNEFLNGTLKKTGKEYVTDSRKTFDYSQIFRPIKHIEYEYNGKKYVRVKNNSIFMHQLSNGVIPEENDYVWVEVSPITWYVDENSKILISKTLLASGIRFCDHGNYKDNFRKTEMYMFLNKYFAKNIVTSKLQTEEKKLVLVDNKFTIEKLIEEIYEYCKDVTNSDELIKMVDGIIKQYNEKVAKIHELKKNSIPTLESLTDINNRLELRLRLILDDLKRHHEEYKVYYEMLDVINEYVGIINGSKEEKNYALSDDLNVIINVCVPYLSEKDGNMIKNHLLVIFNDYREKILHYLDNSNVFDKHNNDCKLKCNSIDEMNFEIREKIHPLLVELCSSVSKRDIELEIQDFMQKTINGLYSEPKNKFLALYLTEINTTYKNILELMEKLSIRLQKEYKEELNNIMIFNIDYGQDFNLVTRNLIEIWLRLNRILYSIQKYLNEMDELNYSYIDVRKIKNKFI